MKIADTILAVLSDMHTGSSTALFPRRGYVNMERNLVSPNPKQRNMYPVFVRFSGEVAKARKGRRLIVVMLGDAVDGFHHGSLQESLYNYRDQNGAHIELMQEFMKRTGFTTGDELHYVRGTEVHVGEHEFEIAKDLHAKKTATGEYVNEVLEMNINGTLHAFVHHGKGRGAGANEGNSLRNFLRDIRIDRNKDNLPRLDVMWSGHTHGHTWTSHHARLPNGCFHQFHGIICPSWQAKTVYAHGKVPMTVNSVGGVYCRITPDGYMLPPHFVVQVTERGDKVLK